MPHLHIGQSEEPEGVKTSRQRIVLLVMAITLHNIPEAQQEKHHSNIGTIGAMIGFAIMMLLDVALG